MITQDRWCRAEGPLRACSGPPPRSASDHEIMKHFWAAYAVMIKASDTEFAPPLSHPSKAIRGRRISTHEDDGDTHDKASPKQERSGIPCARISGNSLYADLQKNTPQRFVGSASGVDDSDGNCPTCDEYDRRLAQLISCSKRHTNTHEQERVTDLSAHLAGGDALRSYSVVVSGDDAFLGAPRGQGKKTNRQRRTRGLGLLPGKHFRWKETPVSVGFFFAKNRFFPHRPPGVFSTPPPRAGEKLEDG